MSNTMAHLPPEILAKSLHAAAAETLQRIDRDRRQARSRVARILGYVRLHLFDPELNVNKLRQDLAIRDNAVSSIFRAEIGETLRDYIESRRLEIACRLLTRTRIGVTRVSEWVGYRSEATFSFAFKRTFGCRPRAFRQAHGFPGDFEEELAPGWGAPPTTPLPRYLIGIAALSGDDRCGRCGVPFEEGMDAVAFEMLQPICDLCALEVVPDELKRFLVSHAAQHHRVGERPPGEPRR